MNTDFPLPVLAVYWNHCMYVHKIKSEFITENLPNAVGLFNSTC
jgi:hypothetical protein